MKRVWIALAVALIALALVSSGAQAAPATAIDVCCAWNGNLTNGDLTYKISGGDEAAQATVRTAVQEWDTDLALLDLTEVSGNTKPNIDIKFKRGGGAIQGQALRKFDDQGFITSVRLTISGKAFGDNINAVGKITLHEMGHALGAGHADGGGVVMSPTVSGGSDTLTDCDIAAVVAANHWKLHDGASTPPHQPHVDSVSCDGGAPPPDGGLTGTLNVNVLIDPPGPFDNRDTVHIFFKVTQTGADGDVDVEGAVVQARIVTPNPRSDRVGNFTTDDKGVAHTHFKVNSGRDGTGTYHVEASASKDQASGSCTHDDLACHADFVVN